MILNTFINPDNRKIIADKYVELINNGISADKILVLTFNATSKKIIQKYIFEHSKTDILDNPKIYTYNGLIYNTIIDNWAQLENMIDQPTKHIIPNLSGLEISQYLLNKIIKKQEIKGYNSKKSLLHQIFKRYSLITNNMLSPEEIKTRSEILKEAFYEDANNIIKSYKTETIKLRAFDYIRQRELFAHIFKNTDYFKNIEHLITEDTDECTPLFLEFINTIAPQLRSHTILLDNEGSSRRGYLCAEVNAGEKLKSIFNEEIINTTEIPQNIKNLTDNILNNKQNVISNLSLSTFSKRLDMIDNVIAQIKTLLENDITPNDIAIITPIQDNMLKFTINEALKIYHPKFIAGNKKLVDIPIIKAIINILKLSTGIPVKNYELRVIFAKWLSIPLNKTQDIFSKYEEFNKFIPLELNEFSTEYNNFVQMLTTLEKSDTTLSQKAYYIYSKLNNNISKEDINQFNFLLKELQDFERIFNKKDFTDLEKEIIIQLENSIISENPYETIEFNTNSIIISTPQKIIDNKIQTKYQIWLDTSSEEWIKPDIGPLYNSWVFQKNWDKDNYSIEDNIQLTKEKTAKIIRKLMLLTEKVFAYSSLFDTQGVENIKGIEEYLISSAEQKNTEQKLEITPRDDQKPVLYYTKGKMAITAVPGAGKTTILLALIIKLLNKKINPNNIFVLTYMESAARNFKERIKLMSPNTNQLPQISTIHGLALKILKENSNHERLGLNSDFEICDDIQRGTIINSLSKELTKQEIEDFDRAVSVLKLSGTNLNIETNTKIKYLLNLKQGTGDIIKLSRFLKFYYKYNNKLKEENLIDYDDILIYAVKLLENNPDILKYYQNICHYIIEDEAQDSSFIQQQLINLLSGKYKNIIRCGDINQAITTTFTNADITGFKEFIRSSEQVNMNYSQRCSKGVMDLANKLVQYGNNTSIKPFYEIYMNPVQDKNPVEKTPIIQCIYDNENEEKRELTNTIKELLKNTPDCSIGILLRNNFQVNKWANYINNNGLTSITRNECLKEKTIFKVIFAILTFISKPFDNKICAETYNILSECGIFPYTLTDEILNTDKSFITINNEEIQNPTLAKFHWEMNYWLNLSDLTPDELVIKIGLSYFTENITKSNIHLIATLCAKLYNGDFEDTLNKLENLSQKVNLSGFKFFEGENNSKELNGKIQIMTLHKSKGDEFDYVFIPELSEKNLTLDVKQLKLKKMSDFIENVRTLNNSYKKKTTQEMKEFLISENYRLLYVALSRAKRRLYLSVSQNEKIYNQLKKAVPSIIFTELLK